MSPRYRAPRGTVDILPEEQPYWEHVYQTATRLCQVYGYSRIDTPIFEEAGLFARGVGQTTDIVQKEMYVFQDRGGEMMALRPEGTANVCRAYIQHGMRNLPQPVRLYYWGPAFRYDRPQAGRQRQFTHFGCEAIGENDPALDAELIELAWRLYQELGIADLTLQLNSVGDANCRPRYLAALKAHYQDKIGSACPDCRARFDKNPLRLLDCKVDSCQPVIASAPPFVDYLCEECAQHFQELRSYLEAMGIPYTLNPRLVRGLDYYTRTVFEIQPPEEGAQNTVGAGGRYDGLIEELGGRPTPAIGFATGIERIIANLKRTSVAVPAIAKPAVFVAYQMSAARSAASRLASELRRAGIAAVMAVGGRSLKAQMRQANAVDALYAAILGEEELATDTVILRRMEDGQQERVATKDVRRLIAKGLRQAR
ncbi:MAG: histidyl-tRNA synthetase [Dehalococcoidia bacterium SM23_28_2]|nr:MAG: histidyl-tRNA synthetase [Dehalococcoidia bacterium SM23_28_2]